MKEENVLLLIFLKHDFIFQSKVMARIGREVEEGFQVSKCVLAREFALIRR